MKILVAHKVCSALTGYFFDCSVCMLRTFCFDGLVLDTLMSIWKCFCAIALSRIAHASLHKACQRYAKVIQRLYPRGRIQGRGLWENQARAERARRF